MRVARYEAQVRFPRLADGDKDVLFMSSLRRRYPPPHYDFRYDGAYNPADTVIEAGLRQDKPLLKKLCRKHGLSTKGSKRKLMKRMYLHWRDVKFATLGMRDEGDGKYIGYGKGYERVGFPVCPCGNRIREENKPEKVKFDVEHRRFPRLAKWDDGHKRFPRLK